MIFYPRIDEAEETDIQMPTGDRLNQLIGVKKAKFVPGTHEISSAGGQTRQTPINSNFIRNFKKGKLRELLIDFVFQYLRKHEIKYSKDKFEKALDRNKKVAFPENKEKLEQMNFIREEVDKLGLKFGDFWDRRIEEFLENPSIVDPKMVGGKKDVRKKKEKEKIVYPKIPKEVYDYFATHEKKNELEEFRGSLPLATGFVNDINKIFEFMKTLIESKGEVEIPTLGGKNYGKIKGAQKNKMISDMIQYVGSYDDIEEFSKSGIYENEILTKSVTFLQLLFNIKDINVKKGKGFIAYCISDAALPEGAQYSDIITEGKKSYVLKDQSQDPTENPKPISIDAGEYIRYDFWKNISSTISIAQEIYDTIGKKELKKSIGNYFFQKWENVISKKSDDKYAVAPGVENGRLTNSQILTLKIWYYLAKQLDMNDLVSPEENKYTMAILKGSGVKSRSVMIEPLNPDKVGDTEKISIEAKEDLETIIQRLKSIRYVKRPWHLENDLNAIAENFFEQNKNIDYLLIFRGDGINLVEESDISPSLISKFNIEFIENMYIKRDNSAKQDYKKFVEEIENAKEKATSENESALTDALSDISYEDFYKPIHEQKTNENFQTRFYPRQDFKL